MKIVFASDAFKNSLSSSEIADILADVAHKTLSDINTVKLNIADGGEGSLDILSNTLKLNRESVLSVDENLKEIKTHYATGENFAIIESAKVINLKVRPKNILDKSSYGVGILINDALNKGFNKIYLTLGGVATNDGGIGLLNALGYKFLDESYNEVAACVRNIKKIRYIDAKNVNKKIKNLELIILCDVNNPFVGKNGATMTYAKQKGANPQEQIILEESLIHLNKLFIEQFKTDLKSVKGSGAAGGIAGALYAVVNANIQSGIETILDFINFDEIIKDADLIITGEGKLDQQSLNNKVPIGIAKRAKKLNIPTVAIVGLLEVEIEILEKYGISSVITTTKNICSLNDLMKNAKANYYDAAYRLFNLIKIFRNN